jgi:sulfoxide reductase heme-binding subunit YedZ
MLKLCRTILDAPIFSWVILFLPAPPLLIDLIERNRYYAEIMYETGLLACQLLIVAMAITPLLWLCRYWPPALKVLRWLQKRRRFIGVAAFGYATLHVVFYIRHVGSMELVWLELEEWELASGWLAFLPMALLALTSNDWSVKLFGRYWKPLQRWVYWVALLTILHWWLIDQFLNDMMIWFLPLIALQLWRTVRKVGAGT